MKQLVFFLILAATIQHGVAQEQDDPIVVQFSGIVVTGDSAYGIPHVHIYVPASLRGTETNDMGYFTMPALAGDSVIITHVGYKKQHLVLPDGKDKQSYTYVIELNTDTTQLDEITIFPYPTFQIFKEAFVNADIPKEEGSENWQSNLEKEKLEKMMLAMSPSASENYRYYTLQEIQRIEQGNMVAVNPLTNLFAWVQLIQELNKRAKERKKEKADDAEESDF